MTTAIETSPPESTAKAENAVINSRNGRRPDQDRTTKPAEFGAAMPNKDAKPSQISQQNQGDLNQGEDEGEAPNSAKRITLSPLPVRERIKVRVRIQRSDSTFCCFAPLRRRSYWFDFSAGSS